MLSYGFIIVKCSVEYFKKYFQNNWDIDSMLLNNLCYEHYKIIYDI